MTTDTQRPVCFVISPIGREGTEHHQTFRDVLEYIIKPAVKESGANLEVIRADDIQRAGSFIKDILDYIATSDVVIADLTTQNPNVFYELGVRHALSARTILVAQTMEDIPSDLREHRTIVYDTSAKGAAMFRERLGAFLQEMQREPGRPDNPVLDRLGSIFEARTQELQQEITTLRGQLETVLKKGTEKRTSVTAPALHASEPVARRVDRIIRLYNGRQIVFRKTFTLELEGETKEFSLPADEGSFNLYHLQYSEDHYRLWYVATADRTPPLDSYIADIRVLLEQCARVADVHVEFVVAAPKATHDEVTLLESAFKRLLEFVPDPHQQLYQLHVWDEAHLAGVEREMGIRIEINQEPKPAKGRVATSQRTRKR